jgi:hypothetical protein
MKDRWSRREVLQMTAAAAAAGMAWPRAKAKKRRARLPEAALPPRWSDGDLVREGPPDPWER